MKSNSTRKSSTLLLDSGFIALVAVILLTSGTLVFSLMTLASAVSFADQVNRRELRIQAKQNAVACLDTVKLMFAKDYFLNGVVSVSDFGCVAKITNDFYGNISVIVTTTIEGVSVRYQQ